MLNKYAWPWHAHSTPFTLLLAHTLADRSFEGAIAALGAPLVGWLAEKAFGFKVSAPAAAGCKLRAMQAARASWATVWPCDHVSRWPLCLVPTCRMRPSPTAQGTAETSGDVAANLGKARSLGNALLVFTALPWALCALFFSGLHWTYPRDRRRAEELALAMHPARVELAELVGESEGEDEEWAAAGGGGDGSPEAEPRLEDSAAWSVD